MIEFLSNYWWVILIFIAAIAVAGYCIYVFVKRPTNEQLDQLKQWLLFAVTEAEKELGSGTGQIKLRYVYDMFLARFPVLSKVVSFELFSVLVDEVLDQFRELLNQNESIKTYVEK